MFGVVEPGEEESVGRYGLGARNREGRTLGNSREITYRSGQHTPELDMLIVRKQQLWKIKDCKAGEPKSVVFVVRIQKKKQIEKMGRRTIKWWRCKDDVAVEYKYEDLSEDVVGLEEE